MEAKAAEEGLAVIDLAVSDVEGVEANASHSGGDGNLCAHGAGSEGWA